MVKILCSMLAGSHMYGTNHQDSDVDIRGVCFPDKSNILGLSGFEQWQPSKKEAEEWSLSRFNIKSDDITIYGLHKFAKLALDCNPNIIEMLFCQNLESSPQWEELLKCRDLFVSQKAIHTFSGYAYSQLKRIKTHYKWANEPPIKPDPMNYGLEIGPNGEHIWPIGSLRNAYKNKLSDYQSYETWKKNRNPKRLALEEKYGYDTKHAMHLFRLFFEASELLGTGKITLPLQKSTIKILKNVYRGVYSYDEIVTETESMDESLKNIPTSVPHKPNRKQVDELIIKMTYDWLIH